MNIYKIVNNFMCETGYTDITVDSIGVRKDYVRKSGWTWESPSKMLRDFVKWQRKNTNFGWKSILREPKDGNLILGYSEGFVTVCAYDPDAMKYVSNNGYGFYPTHWMPIPDAFKYDGGKLETEFIGRGFNTKESGVPSKDSPKGEPLHHNSKSDSSAVAD